MKHTKNCITCDTKLTTSNWYPSRIKKREYRCKSCSDFIRMKNRIKKGEKSPSLFAKFFGIKHKDEYNSVTEGDVYIITNPAWKGWIKVGMAIDAEDRCNGYQTSSPLRDYTLKFKKFFNNRRKAEQKAHKLIARKAKGPW